MKRISILYVLAFAVLTSCDMSIDVSNNSDSKDQSEDKTDQVDLSVVSIAGMEFTTKNLNVLRYRNGDEIAFAESAEEWEAFTESEKGCYANLKYDSKNERKHGYVYNGFAIADERNLAPEGYHITTQDEWKVLVEDLGGDSIAGNELKAVEDWFVPGSNSAGFNAYPGGNVIGGEFSGVGGIVYYWTSSLVDDVHPPYFNHFSIYDLSGEIRQWYDHPGYGMYVRLVKD